MECHISKRVFCETHFIFCLNDIYDFRLFHRCTVYCIHGLLPLWGKKGIHLIDRIPRKSSIGSHPITQNHTVKQYNKMVMMGQEAMQFTPTACTPVHLTALPQINTILECEIKTGTNATCFHLERGRWMLIAYFE